MRAIQTLCDEHQALREVLDALELVLESQRSDDYLQAELALEALEHARAGGYSRDSSGTAASWTLPVAGDPKETVPFRLRLPPTFGPYRGRHSEVTYVLVVSADVALGLDVSTRISLG